MSSSQPVVGRFEHLIPGRYRCWISPLTALSMTFVAAVGLDGEIAIDACDDPL